MINRGKPAQIGVRLGEELTEKIRVWAQREDLTATDFARKLLKIVAPLYDRAGSLHVLRERTAKSK